MIKMYSSGIAGLVTWGISYVFWYVVRNVYCICPISAFGAGIFHLSEPGFHPHLLHPHALQPAGRYPGQPRRTEAKISGCKSMQELQGRILSAVLETGYSSVFHRTARMACPKPCNDSWGTDMLPRHGNQAFLGKCHRQPGSLFSGHRLLRWQGLSDRCGLSAQDFTSRTRVSDSGPAALFGFISTEIFVVVWMCVKSCISQRQHTQRHVILCFNGQGGRP